MLRFGSAAQFVATPSFIHIDRFEKSGHWEAMMTSSKMDSDLFLELRKDLELEPYRFWWLGDWGHVSFKSHMVHPQLTNYFNDIKSKNALFFIRPFNAFLRLSNPGLRWVQGFPGSQTVWNRYWDRYSRPGVKHSSNVRTRKPMSELVSASVHLWPGFQKTDWSGIKKLEKLGPKLRTIRIFTIIFTY